MVTCPRPANRAEIFTFSKKTPTKLVVDGHLRAPPRGQLRGHLVYSPKNATPLPLIPLSPAPCENRSTCKCENPRETHAYDLHRRPPPHQKPQLPLLARRRRPP